MDDTRQGTDEGLPASRIAIGTEAQAEALRALARLDAETAAAYDRGARSVEGLDDEIRENLARFRDDHLRHVEEINDLLSRQGAPAVSVPDFDATTDLLPTLAAVAEAVAPEALILALLANEELTNQTYDTLVQVDFDPDTREVLQRAYEDEEAHLEYLHDVAEGILEAAQAGAEERAEETAEKEEDQPYPGDELPAGR